MRTYPAENWKRLGNWVYDQRLRAEFTDIDEWAAKVERSTRQVRGLERGEPVGEKTLINVARALDRPLADLIDILAASDEVPIQELEARVEHLQRQIAERRGQSVGRAMRQAQDDAAIESQDST